MGLLGLSLIVNLVGWGGQVSAASTAAPVITISAAKSPLAQADKAADKLAKNKPTIANPGKPAKNTQSSAKTAPYKQTTEEICRTIEQAATENQLPVNFFVRVIWQESRFNPRLVGRKGAIGIAQFMRETADFRGLADPFDPISSIENAARYLADLRKMFGNLGLAAAGYNAGPGRVREWLDRKGALPKETRDYVAITTGWTADEWTSPSPPKTEETSIPQSIPCAKINRFVSAPLKQAPRESFGDPGLVAACYPGQVREWLDRKRALIATGWTADEWASRSPLKAAETTAVSQGVSLASTAHLVSPPTEAQHTASRVPGWGAQLTANWSQERALATYRAMQKQFAALIGDREPIMLHGTFPGLGAAPRYMVRIADDNRAYLERLCNKLIAAGGACAVLRNEEDQGARLPDSQSDTAPDRQ